MTRIWKRWLGFAQKYKNNRRYFRRSLVLILLIASIPGLIIGFSTYWISTNNLEQELRRLHQNQIQHRAENIDDQLTYLEMTMSHWAFDPKFDEKLKDLSIARDFEQVQEMYRTLLVMEGAHPLLQKVELYLSKPRPMRFNKEKYVYLTDSAENDGYASLLTASKSAFWTNQFPKDSQDNLSLVNKIPGGSMEPFGAIVATLNKEKLLRVLKTLNPYNEGITLLLNKDLSWSISTGDRSTADMEAALRQEYTDHSNTASGSLLFEYHKSNYSVSYGQFNRLGSTWVYISAAPLTSIIAPVVVVSKWIVAISFSGLVLGLVLSWFVSRRIYSPVERLISLLTGGKGSEGSDEFDWLEKHWKDQASESESMRSKLKEQLPVLREGFFLQLAQGYLYSLRENEIRERMKHYGWETEDRQYVALMFRLTGFANLEGRFSLGDEDLVTFAAANIIEEMVKKRYDFAEVINFHNFSIGLLLALPTEHPSKWLEDDLELLCSELTQIINQIIKMRVTIAISQWSYSAKQIPAIFEEVKQAMAYRDLHDDNQLIWAARLAKLNGMQEIGYPFTLDKEIINAIRSGLEDEAADLIRQFMDELSANGSTEFFIQQGMLQLLGSIRYAALQSGMNPIQLFGNVNLYEQLAKIKERDEMLKWFQYKIVNVFVQEMISRQDFHLKQIVEKVIVYLREQYMTALSLESCADKFGTSPYTLSRAFKQIAGINFIDMLTNIRIENAKALLKDTDMKINEVAESVGYQHSYFNRIFKKYEGITPSQFREMNRT